MEDVTGWRQVAGAVQWVPPADTDLQDSNLTLKML